MIESAARFLEMRTSENLHDQDQASRENAPLEVWLEIIGKYPDLRRWVAHNKTVPAVVLEMLADDSDPAVRATVARRRSAPSGVLERLARDEDATVRARVASNKRAPLGVVRRLAEDQSWVVRDAAKNALEARRPASDQL